jgi:hypothetical protein
MIFAGFGLYPLRQKKKEFFFELLLFINDRMTAVVY